MQNRMKTHQLSTEEISQLLEKVQTGAIATLNPDGSPYVVPVHFVYYEDSIYIHGLPKGQKISNISTNSKVSFTAYDFVKLLLDPNEKPCDTNTEYQSIVASGTANKIADLSKKQVILHEIIKKYTPQLSEMEIPNNMLNGTAVIEIKIDSLTGKYYA